MPWAMRWAAATARYLRPSSTASTAGSRSDSASTMPTQTCRALRGWRRYGKRSAAPRATPQNTIWSENRWYFRCSGCLRKQRDSPRDDDFAQIQPARSIQGPQSTVMASATNSQPAYFLTTPIFYPNGVPHIGHAYTAMVTDAIARFQRLDGFDVLFLTGTDEHGLKMQQTAIAEGLTPLALADRNSARFRDMMAALNISYDDYIRTTEPRHKRACQALWTAIEKNGDIYLGKYAGWYSVRQEGYFDESETVVGEDGIRREPLGSPVEWTEEESYFFRLSAYQEKLLELYARVPDFVLPRERLNEVASFVKSGLQDISVSRTTFDWGIKVPGAPGHVMYVWMDALTNYITAAGYPDVDGESFKRYWPANLHVTGKDIVRFHAVYWPAFLMSAGVAGSQRPFSHGFLLYRGGERSKLGGNVVAPFCIAGKLRC